MAILTIFMSLLGCGKGDPHILDGPGMEYIDSDYRTEYANCLPFDDTKGEPYMAVAYLGNGDEGKIALKEYTEEIFESLGKEKIDEIKSYEYEGNDWFLVIPRYRSLADLKKGDEVICRASQNGEPFAVRCNRDVVVNIFEVEDIFYTLSTDEKGKLANIDENVWDITDIDEIIN